MITPEPRLVTVSRRAFLRAATIGGAGLALGACGKTDAETFAEVDAATSEPTDIEAALSTTTEATSRNTTTSAVDGPSAPTAEMLVSFSYTPDGSGKRENPYIAVWVETPDGLLVDTVALWFEQSEKGDRWLDDLRSWYDASSDGDDVTMSAATRAAGDYTVSWDVTDLAGQAVQPGAFVLFVESARENGPHHITSTPIQIGDPTPLSLADDGELSAVSVAWA